MPMFVEKYIASIDKSHTCRHYSFIGIRTVAGIKKPRSLDRSFLCSHYLSSRAVARQVLSAYMSLTSVFGMAANPTAACGGGKGGCSVYRGRRGTTAHCRRGHSPGTANGNRWTSTGSLSIKRESGFLLTHFCVGITYLPGQSPAKYCRRR